MPKWCCALLLAAVTGFSAQQSRAQTAVDVSRFDIAGIRLRMPIAEVAAALKHRQEQDGGEILGEEELEKAIKDANAVTDTRYFGYSTPIYKIGITLSPAYRAENKSFPPSVIDVVFVINNYNKNSDAIQQVMEKYGEPTFQNRITGELKYCQHLIGAGSDKTCDAKHGDTLFFVNGALYLSDRELAELTHAKISAPSAVR